MSWTQGIFCDRCGQHFWHVKDGVWTCRCGKPMTVAEIEDSRG